MTNNTHIRIRSFFELTVLFSLRLRATLSSRDRNEESDTFAFRFIKIIIKTEISANLFTITYKLLTFASCSEIILFPSPNVNDVFPGHMLNDQKAETARA